MHAGQLRRVLLLKPLFFSARCDAALRREEVNIHATDSAAIAIGAVMPDGKPVEGWMRGCYIDFASVGARISIPHFGQNFWGTSFAICFAGALALELLIEGVPWGRALQRGSPRWAPRVTLSYRPTPGGRAAAVWIRDDAALALSWAFGRGWFLRRDPRLRP